LAAQEAYEVLCDAVRLTEYDRQLTPLTGTRHIGRRVNPEPLRSEGCPIESLVPTRRSIDPWDLRPGVHSHFPLQELLGPSWIGSDVTLQTSIGRAEHVRMEVALSPRPALLGGHIRVWVPVQLLCPACRGQGRVGFYECPRCFGHGLVSEQYPVEVDLPAGVADGATGSTRLRRPGMHDLSRFSTPIENQLQR